MTCYRSTCKISVRIQTTPVSVQPILKGRPYGRATDTPYERRGADGRDSSRSVTRLYLSTREETAAAVHSSRGTSCRRVTLWKSKCRKGRLVGRPFYMLSQKKTVKTATLFYVFVFLCVVILKHKGCPPETFTNGVSIIL